MQQAVTIPDMANGTGICTCIIYYIGERWSTFVVGLQVIRIWIDLVSVLRVSRPSRYDIGFGECVIVLQAICAF